MTSNDQQSRTSSRDDFPFNFEPDDTLFEMSNNDNTNEEGAENLGQQSKTAQMMQEPILRAFYALRNISALIDENGNKTDVFNLPVICVVGMQSSGKSSVLEGFVGRDFLPRGTGIVTKRPLEVRLYPSDSRDGIQNWAKFGHSSRKFTNFDQVRAEIVRVTEEHEECKQFGVSSDPIKLEIYSTHGVNLCLVDLPGLTVVPIGKQPPDIEKRIKRMIGEYISNPKSIILAVVPANDDVANSNTIKMIEHSQRKRTFIVATKLDLKDRGTDALELLKGNHGIPGPPFRAIIGVVNRCQEDIQNNVPIEKRDEQEEKFLMEHYPEVAEKHGIKYLMKELNTVFMESIKEGMPETRNRVSAMLAKCEDEQRKLGEPIDDIPKKMANLISNYVRDYNATIKGTIQAGESAYEDRTGGAKIAEIFHGKYESALAKLDPSKNLDIVDICGYVMKATGMRTGIYMNEETFEELTKERIELMKEPSLNCARMVHKEMKNAIGECGQIVQELKCFPRAFQAFNDLISLALNEQLEIVKSAIIKEVDYQKSYINFNHPEFLKKCAAHIRDMKTKTADEFAAGNDDETEKLTEEEVALLKEKQTHFGWSRMMAQLALKQQQIGGQHSKSNSIGGGEGGQHDLFHDLIPEKEQQSRKMLKDSMEEAQKWDCALNLRLLKSYYQIIRKIIQDKVLKAIVTDLIKHIQDNLNTMLTIEFLYNKADELNDLMAEDEETAIRRKQLVEKIQALHKAENEIGKVVLQ